MDKNGAILGLIAVNVVLTAGIISAWKRARWAERVAGMSDLAVMQVREAAGDDDSE
jgi:hypothetical protein